MFLSILGCAAALLFTFWGSKRDAVGTRLMLFGAFTLYERRRHPALPPPELTFRLGEGLYGEAEGAAVTDETDEDDDAEDEPDEDPDDLDEDDEEEEEEAEEVDERDLWDHLADAGFETIDDVRDLEPGDDGRIDWEQSEYACDECEGQLFDLWEVFKAPSDHPALIGRLFRNPIGHVCRDCGHYCEFDDQPAQPIGRLWPVLGPEVNFFDALSHYEWLREQRLAAIRG